MSIDQIIRCFEIVVWPIAFLLVGSYVTILGHRLAALFEAALSAWKHAESSRQQAAINVAGIAHTKTNSELLAEACEKAVLTVVAANGGLPSEPADWPREIVRHMRMAFAEIEKPTQRQNQPATDHIHDYSAMAMDNLDIDDEEM